MNKATSNGLIVMAKRPFPHRTKTRLVPPLTAEAAADLYECFLHDVLAKVAELENVSPYVAYAPETAVSYFQTIAPSFGLIPQRGETLGERLDFVLTECQAIGHQRVVAMNSDSPTLPAAYLTQAFDSLAEDGVDVVLGPCEDGGYYLIGWKRPYSPLVREVQMSTPTVLQDTLAIAERLGLNVTLLPTWYDVDSEAELARLRSELLADSSNSPRTSFFLTQIGGNADRELGIGDWGLGTRD